MRVESVEADGLGLEARPVDVAALMSGIKERRIGSVAKLISLVEDEHPQLPEIAAALAPSAVGSAVVGITGAPGAGKSTLTSTLIGEFRSQGFRVGVIAIDPSSPFSGGALLGDRIRMGAHGTDDGVYIRSMATRGHLGGLSWATPQAIRVLDAAGYDVILIETVGVGQSEVDVASLADTTLVVLAPGLGDAVQAAKAGLLEVADVFVVNKADRDGAGEVARDLKQMIAFGRNGKAGPSWRQPVVETVSSRGGGAAELATAIGRHREWLKKYDELDERRTVRAVGEVQAIVLERLRSRLGELPPEQRIREVSRQVAGGELDPYSAAARVLEGLDVSANSLSESGLEIK